MVEERQINKRNILLLIGVISLIFIGLFRNQLKSLFTIFYGVAIDKTINLTRPKMQSFNIALLGIGGGNHDGPNLTDTIIIANVNVVKDEVHLFSIPRDLWIPDFNQKINAAYQIGIDNNNGLGFLKQTLTKVSGQNIDYTVVLNFDGFVKLVDELGGVDVNVKNTLDDYNYPIEGKETDKCGHSTSEIQQYVSTVSAEMQLWDFFSCRYKHLHIAKGMNHMDGMTALEFVRSRHGVGVEGSDFARSQRQELVISAVRQKALSLGVLLNPVKMLDIYNILKDNIKTDIPSDKIDDFIKLSEKLKGAKINSTVIDIGNPDQGRYGLLINPPIDQSTNYQWVLIPRVGMGNFSEIHDYISCLNKDIECTVGVKGILTPTPTPSIAPSKTTSK